MSAARNNHYVPCWYQKLFFEPGRTSFAYLDMQPDSRTLPDGRVIKDRFEFDSPPKRCFHQMDLYSTVFGTHISDEIERRLFGPIDTQGSKAVRAFCGTDIREWHRHFETLFTYLDIQKIRTPKGLDWLIKQYPSLGQNELMMEMQGIRNMHCTIWTEGVREIVSAEEANVKFIVSDHPVTIYNHALPPGAGACLYPHDPSIALKGSQTIFPLSRDFCLILTNLEYAKNPDTDALQKRTFARNFRSSMVRTDTFIRTRKFSDLEVGRINRVLKGRARRYVAAGRAEWLNPEPADEPWESIRETLLPPKDELWHFGGELYASFKDGHVHYQDAFGRTEKEREFLKKTPPTSLRPSDACGCGSGKAFRDCCKSRPQAFRPSWQESSIRERNCTLFRAICDILGIDKGKNWIAIRRNLTNEQIKKIYVVYEALWPLETDLLGLLPKPDGRPRAVYTGALHPQSIVDFALGASLYFGELIVQHPFTHAGTVVSKFSPTKNPRSFHQEFLKDVLFFLQIFPLVEFGFVNLVPDPCDFDQHLRRQMMTMARARSAPSSASLKDDPRLEALMKLDFKRDLLQMPEDYLRRQLRASSPELDERGLDEAVQAVEAMKRADPLASLKPNLYSGKGGKGGQFRLMKLAPNFEMTMYLAQATGAAIVTDSPSRWNELRAATQGLFAGSPDELPDLVREIDAAEFLVPQTPEEIVDLAFREDLAGYPALLGDAFNYLARIDQRGRKPNWEQQAAARFRKIHSAAQKAIRKRDLQFVSGRMTCAFPAGGFQDNTVNRLLLMSSSERHLPMVPTAFYFESDRLPEK